MSEGLRGLLAFSGLRGESISIQEVLLDTLRDSFSNGIGWPSGMLALGVLPTVLSMVSIGAAEPSGSLVETLSSLTLSNAGIANLPLADRESMLKWGM